MNALAALATEEIFEMAMPMVVFLATFVFGILLRRFLFVRLLTWAKSAKSGIDDIIIEATAGPFIIWVLILAIYFGLKVSMLADELALIAGKILLVLGIGSVTLALANISTRFIKIYSTRIESSFPVTTLTQNINRIIIFGIGILVILNSLGVSVTPILATLGVGGLAVALALQDTLSNFFSGFYLAIARQIRVGDYIKLESGEEGYVTDINWRVTKIKMLANNVVLVPNEKLTKAIITNYYLPDKETAVLVELGVHFNSDLNKVERITSEVAKETMKEVAGGVLEFEPFIRYHTFGDFTIQFTVILRAKEFVDQYLIKHEFIKRLKERYVKEGIVIPYPIRAINYEQEKTR